MTHPTPETLVGYALGADEPATARHVEDCAVCRGEIERLRDAAQLFRSSRSLDRLVETTNCLDELTIADFVEGRLGADARAPVVTHLLTCARCRSVVLATGRIVAETAAQDPGRGRLRWYVPLGVAAAAAVLFLVWPRTADDRDTSSGLRTPADTGTVPVLIAPRAVVTRADRFVWSHVPGADRYRLRLYDEEGAVRWTVETSDTVVALPDSVALSPDFPYFWKVEAQTEWQRWVASDLIEFQLPGPRR